MSQTNFTQSDTGTIGFAESMPEYCGVISDHPNVCPTASFVEEEEAKNGSGSCAESL